MLIMKVEKDGDVLFKAPIRTLFSLLNFRGSCHLPRPYRIVVTNLDQDLSLSEEVNPDDEV